MTSFYQSLSPSSAFYQPRRSSQLAPSGSKRITYSSSSLFQKQCQLDDDFVSRLDQTDVLGGWNANQQLIGHSGCINALSWSQSGELLASGSDDRNVVLWKLGSSEVNATSVPEDDDDGTPSRRAQLRRASDSHVPSGQGTDTDDVVARWPQRSYPSLEMAMMGKIQTGHRANIFSVKWAPYSADRRIFTCAGDRQVRVFDINYSGTGPGGGQSHRMADGKEYTLWNDGSGACIRTFHCHKDRAKRISTENSPDVFLTCAEDGDVRQMDLRTRHVCGSRRDYGEGCPAPLAHFDMGLYSLSVSKVEPWLFAVAGMSPYAYLQDRRMIPRLLKRDWGMELHPVNPEAREAQALTMCVRRFGEPPGGFQRPRVEEDGKTVRLGKRVRSQRATSRSGTRHRHANGSDGDNDDDDDDDGNGESESSDEEDLGNEVGNDVHATACKINESTGRDIIVSYSSGGIFRFGLYDEPEILHHTPEKVVFRKTQSVGSKSEGSDTSVEQDPQDRVALRPYLDTMKARCYQALFPQSVAAELKEQHVRVAAFWDDIRDLDDLLGSRRDDDGDPVEEYTAVEVCRVLGTIAFPTRATVPSVAAGEPSLAERIRDSIDRIHDRFEGYRINRDIAPLLEELERALGWQPTGEYDKIKDELWIKAEELVAQLWGEGVTTRAAQGSAGAGHRVSEGRQPKRLRIAGVAEPGEHTEGSGPTGESSRPGTDLDAEQVDAEGSGQEGSEVDIEEADTDEGGGEDEDNDQDDDGSSSVESDTDDSDEEELDSDDSGAFGFDTDMSLGIENPLQQAPIVYPRNVYTGHANVETVKDVNFAGRDDRYVVSGSDDGNWFMWDTETARLKGIWKGDSSVVNVLQQHPCLPVVAISGIDDTVKLFGPVTLSPPGVSTSAATTTTRSTPTGKVADRMDKRESIIQANQARIQSDRTRPSLSTRALLSMLQQHVLQGATVGTRAGREGAAGEGPHRMVLRPLLGGGFQLISEMAVGDDGVETQEGEERDQEDCTIM